MKIASTVGPCSEIDEFLNSFKRHIRLGSGAGSASIVDIHGKQDQGDTAVRDCGVAEGDAVAIGERMTGLRRH